jgi:hypothetical protein
MILLEKAIGIYGEKMTLLLLGLGCTEFKLYENDGSNDGSDDDSGASSLGDPIPDTCEIPELPGEELGIGDSCPTEPEGGFTPVVEWTYGEGRGCLSLPVVADINLDGAPEIILNLTGLFNAPGELVVLNGDGSGVMWTQNAQLAYGSPVAAGDIDSDGRVEIVSVREYESALFSTGDYTIQAWDELGNQLWESAHFVGLDFDWATAPVLADMDGDGNVEIIAGRVILNSDGTTRGIGTMGRGSYGVTQLGDFVVSEGSVPAVSDLDLDGYQEIIVGNARYDAEGQVLWSDSTQEDAMISVANLDSDPEGEVIAVSYNTIRAVDTDGSIIWGPITFPDANILSPAAIADVDFDGMPEILVAGGNALHCLNHDGTTLWTAAATDESGATGASIFDFEGDGKMEVVYIDEVQLVALDGETGAVKFQSGDHASNTMFDYPVIADIDGDDNAEILVCHNGFSHAFSVYGDLDNSWVAARPLWNQHAYSIGNINDDLTIPTQPEPSFVTSNTWHSALSSYSSGVGWVNIEPEIVDVCLDDCANGTVFLSFRVHNSSSTNLQEPFFVTVFAVDASGARAIEKIEVSDAIQPGWTNDAILVPLSASALSGADQILLSIDDDGFGTGRLEECSELDNHIYVDGPFCE